VVARQLAPKAKILGVNTDASPGMWLSRKDKKAHLKMDSKPTIAEGLEGGVSESTYKLGLEYIDDVLVVKEESLKRAIAELLRRHRMAVEGSAAASVAAIMEGLLPKSCKRVCAVLTGSNIDAERLKSIVNAYL
jgi:threonine dehydratase